MKRNRSNLILVVLLVASLLGLFTYAYLGSYSRYIADDYCSAATEIKLGVLRAAWYWYISWTGRYAANLLDAFFGRLGPHFTPAVTPLVLIIWLTALGTAFFQALPIGRRDQRLLISAVLGTSVLFVTLTLTPSVQQSLYWGQGMRSVVPPLILGTCFICCCQWFQKRDWSTLPFILWLFLGMLLCFVAGGFSETYAVFQISALLLGIYIFRMKKNYVLQQKPFYFLLSGLLGAVLALCVVVIAPGNRFREAYSPPPPAFLSLAAIAIKSFLVYLVQISGSFEKILGLAGAIAVGGLTGMLIDSKPGQAKTLVMILVIGLGLVFSCFPPSAYALSDAPPDRTLIIPTYALVLTLVILGISAGHLLSSRRQIYQVIVTTNLLFFLILAMMSLYQMISVRQRYVNYAAAWENFHTQMLSYQRAGIGKVVISTQEMNSNNWIGGPVLGDNPKFWINKCESDYYGVTIISISPWP